MNQVTWNTSIKWQTISAESWKQKTLKRKKILFHSTETLNTQLWIQDWQKSLHPTQSWRWSGMWHDTHISCMATNSLSYLDTLTTSPSLQLWLPFISLWIVRLIKMGLLTCCMLILKAHTQHPLYHLCPITTWFTCHPRPMVKKKQPITTRSFRKWQNRDEEISIKHGSIQSRRLHIILMVVDSDCTDHWICSP